MGKYKYKEIEEYLLKNIYGGVYTVRDALPTEKELCEMFNVSRMTANKALANIEDKGLIERVQGSGSYVRLFEYRHDMMEMTSFTEQYKKRGVQISTKLLMYSLSSLRDFKNFRNIARKLYINQNENVYYFERQRSGNGKVIAYSRTWVPVSRIPNISTDCLSKSFYDFLEKTLKLPLGNGESDLSVIDPDETVKKYMNINDNVPVVLIEHITYLKNGLPIEYVETYYQYSEYKLKFFNNRIT